MMIGLGDAVSDAAAVAASMTAPLTPTAITGTNTGSSPINMIEEYVAVFLMYPVIFLLPGSISNGTLHTKAQMLGAGAAIWAGVGLLAYSLFSSGGKK